MNFLSRRNVILLFGVLWLSGCATPMQKSGFWNGVGGGYSEKQIQDDLWRVGYTGNGFTTYETVQTYWLYRCASLAGERGYAGFEILSDVRLTLSLPASEWTGEAHMEKSHAVYTPIFVPGGASNFPVLEADIRLLKEPVVSERPKRYNAAELKAALEPIVNGKKCGGGNVCPHAHEYVYGAPPAQS